MRTYRLYLESGPQRKRSMVRTVLMIFAHADVRTANEIISDEGHAPNE